jgi:CDP-diacylglycerol--serine O-phosphatidyltransferase
VKRIAIIPTLLTLGNGVCGFAAIVVASKIGRIDPADTSGADNQHLILSGWLIFAAMIFDVLDGYAARLSRSASKFGGELDSLCDAISFGVAPAFLIWRLGQSLEHHPFLGKAPAGIAILYLVCALLRLARFNVETAPDPAAHKRFRGLPSPAAGGCLAFLAVLYGELPGKLVLFQKELAGDWSAPDLTHLRQVLIAWTLLGTVVIALFMVSRIPYPRLARQALRGKRHFGHLVELILFAFVIVILGIDVGLLFLFWIYALGIPVRYSLVRQFGRPQLVVPRLEDARD